jgi:hypothetical protein
MFELKGEVYTVEYEGLHMLCRTCGKFGHYMEGCPDKKESNIPRASIEQGCVVNGEGQTINGKDITGGDGPWMVVQKQRRPRKVKESASNNAMAAGPSRNTGTGTRFEILENINEDPEIDGANNDERISCDTPLNNIPNPLHEKGRGNQGKHVADKKGKVAEKAATRVARKQNSMSLHTSGTQNAINTQNIPGRKKGELPRRENQSIDGVSQRHVVVTNDPHAIIGQAPQHNNNEIDGVENSHVGIHHKPRPPDATQSGQVTNRKLDGPNIQSGEMQAQRVDGEDMEIVPETPNLDQEEGGVKSMNLV